jgi:pimeloyl-ACP methyl ester carboxylesterase
MLAYRWLEGEREGDEPLVALHGMFGRGSHLRNVAIKMGLGRNVLLPDLPSHGDSGAMERMDYPAMADELDELLIGLGIDRCMLLGHSMGGKVAMQFALTRNHKVDRIVAMDMAPVEYPPRFTTIFEVLGGLDLGAARERSEVKRLLEERLGDERLAAFLAQALVRSGEGFAWRFNLAGIRQSQDGLRGFPKTPAQRQFRGPAMFLYGDRSSYMQASYWPEILRLFPAAKSRAVAGAGHWLHVERPDEVSGILRGFFS